MGEKIYAELLYLTVFFSALWAAGYFCRIIKLSPILGQILIGILLGPNGLDFAPLFTGEEEFKEVQEFLLQSVEECEAELGNLTGDESDGINSTENRGLLTSIRNLAESSENGEIPEIENYLQVLGILGVTFLIVESGLHVDFNTLKTVGGSAFLVAILGTFLPIVFGTGTAVLLGFDAYPEGLAIGAVLAPTSVGIALKLLHDAHLLDSQFGQTIVTAAFTDDIFSLVTLAVLLELAAGALKATSVLIPLLSSFTFIAVAFLLSHFVVPKASSTFLNAVSDRFGTETRDIVHLTLMFLVLALYGYLGELIGSHLLGAFLTGITFTNVPRTNLIWSREMDTINTWLLAIFFGATVAFAVPVDELLNLESFWKGIVIGVGPGILGKVASGLALKKRWVVGWSMVPRGEFAFLVAQTLRETNFQDTGDKFLSAEGFGVAVWALLLATIVAPVAFGFVLASQLKADEAKKPVPDETEAIEEGQDAKKPDRTSARVGKRQSVAQMRSVIFGDAKKMAPRSEWVITVGAPYQKGLLQDIIAILVSNDIHLKAFLNEGSMDLESTLMTMTVAVPDPSEESENTPGVRMRPSTYEMMRQKDSSMLEVGRFKDDYFSFDIDKYIERIKQRIIGCIHGDKADVKIERQENTGYHVAQVNKDGIPAGPEINEEGGDEDSQ